MNQKQQQMEEVEMYTTNDDEYDSMENEQVSLESRQIKTLFNSYLFVFYLSNFF